MPYGVGKAAIDKVTQDTAIELRPHGVAVVSLWPGLVLTEGLLANTEPHRRRHARRCTGSTSSFGETPKFNGKAVVALAADPDILERVRRLVLDRADWPASTASPRTTGTCHPRCERHPDLDGADDIPDYWRGVERSPSVRPEADTVRR